MDISKINPGENPSKVNVIIEVPLNSSVKYEVDKDSGIVEVDRMMYSAMSYPANYGFVPNTLSDDGDPADVLVITDAILAPGCLIKSKLIGVLIMEDESGVDEKLIAVPVPKLDPIMANINSLDDLPDHLLKKIKNFFETYKMLEPNKWVKVKDFQGPAEAEKILQSAIDNFKK
jgi:inorganic pyrophosphatase